MSSDLKLPMASLPGERPGVRSSSSSAWHGETRETDGGEGSADQTEACFAALFAWLIEVAPAENGDGRVRTSPMGNEASSPSALASLPRAPGLLFGTADAVTGQSATAAGNAATIETLSTESAQSLLDAAGSRGSDGMSRGAGTIDLSFLSMAASADGPHLTRDVPSVYTPAASTEPRAQLGTELGQRVVLMVEQGVHDARLKVHPEHLGPIEIRVRVEGDAAQVTFHSAHGAVRDALADAVPRLRELLDSSGLDLAHVDIGAGDPSHGETPEHGAAAAQHDAGDAQQPGVETESEETAPPVVVRQGLVDTFA